MKLELAGKTYHAILDAPKLIRIELETGKSTKANTEDPGITFICSAIAAAISDTDEYVSLEEVARTIDLSRLKYYAEIIGALTTEALTRKIDVTKVVKP
jgi:hypothetical protein